VRDEARRRHDVEGKVRFGRWGMEDVRIIGRSEVEFRKENEASDFYANRIVRLLPKQARRLPVVGNRVQVFNLIEERVAAHRAISRKLDSIRVASGGAANVSAFNRQSRLGTGKISGVDFARLFRLDGIAV